MSLALSSLTIDSVVYFAIIQTTILNHYGQYHDVVRVSFDAI